MGQSVQPGISAEVSLREGHTPTAPEMEEFCSHPDPGTKSPSTPLEVSATFCAEVYSPLKTGRVAGHREVLVTMLVQMLDSLKGKPKKKQPKRKKNPDILLWQECKHLLSQDWGRTLSFSEQESIDRAKSLPVLLEPSSS